MSSPSTAAGGEPLVPPTSKTAYALERLRQEIASGAIRPGEPLRQADLARRFGVSPTPVREALRLLEAEGTISYSPHRGATVQELSPDRIRDVYLLRSSVEGLATRLAVERMTPEALERIKALHVALVDGAKRGEQPEQLANWNRDLHLEICATASPLITSHASSLWRMIPARITMWEDAELVGRLNDQHAGIVEAIVAGDADLAAERMAAHVMTAADQRLTLISGELGGDDAPV